MASFVIERKYDWPADRHFQAIIRYDELAEAMEGQARYQGLPAGEAVQGQCFDVNIKMLGWLPIGSWHIEVLERDDTALRLRSLEHGGAVKAWNHTITVVSTGEHSCLHRDALDIDAGWLTGLYTGMARRMYEKRHDQRQVLRSRP